LSTILRTAKTTDPSKATIIADYEARTAVERELVLRLASLLWRIRRATGIETDLLRIQAEIIREQEGTAPSRNASHAASRGLGRLDYRSFRPVINAPVWHEEEEPFKAAQSARQPNDLQEVETTSSQFSRQLTHCFLRLANLDNAIFDRLARYESRLWRQTVQTMFALEPLRHRYRFR
jgi:hypothetical protein